MSKIPKTSTPQPPMPTGVKVASVKPPVAPGVQTDIKNSNMSISTVTKWLPFICAGAAVGVSVLALKELKKVKNEMTVVKTQQTNVPFKGDPELNKKMDQFEVQLKKINEFLMNNNSKNPKIIKNVLKTEDIKDVKIINESDENPEEYEYEEVEVTDDESDDEEK